MSQLVGSNKSARVVSFVACIITRSSLILVKLSDVIKPLEM